MTSRAAYIFNITEDLCINFVPDQLHVHIYAQTRTKMDTASVVTMIEKDEMKDNGTGIRVFARRDFKLKQ